MSRFSETLTEAVRSTLGTDAAFAAASQIGRSQLSGYTTGSLPVGDKVIAKILSALPEPQRLLVAQAWLEDQMPEIVAGQLEVRVLNGQARKGYTPPAACTQQMRDVLDWLAREVDRVP